MDKRADEILDLFKYYQAKELKALQAKFTTFGNGIKREALGGKISALFTLEQKIILKEAADILNGVKHSIAHAKEIKARKERDFKMNLEACLHQRKKLVDEYLPKGKDLLLLRLAVGLHHKDLTDSYNYFPENHYTLTTLERVLNQNHHFKMSILYSTCLSDLRDWLINDSALWPYDEKPSPEPFQHLMAVYQSNWRREVLEIYKDDVGRYDDFYSIELADNIVKINSKST